MTDPQFTTSAAEAEPVPRGYWRDARDNLIPEAKIKAIDKDRDRTVRALTEDAIALSRQIAEFKRKTEASIADFVSRSAAEYKVHLGGKKGSVTLFSFDGRFKVVRAMQDTLAFDERLQVAKKLIDDCLHKWGKGANKNLQAFVTQAFAVDKVGQLNTGRIIGLQQYKIDDEDWQRAMAAIRASMMAVSSKAYVRFYERDANGEYQPIALDVAAL